MSGRCLLIRLFFNVSPLPRFWGRGWGDYVFFQSCFWDSPLGVGVMLPLYANHHHQAHESCGIRHLTIYRTLIKVKLHSFLSKNFLKGICMPVRPTCFMAHRGHHTGVPAYLYDQ
jgi:hypothetical protein